MSTDDPDTFARLMVQLAGDPGFAAFAGPGAALLIWDRAVEHVLGASAAAEGLRRALTGPDGRTDIDPAIRGKLQRLSGGLAPLQSFRLERLRLDPLAPPVTCACRRAVTEDGNEVLVTALVGPVPKLAARGGGRQAPRSTQAPERRDAPPEAGSNRQAFVLEDLRRRGSIRIVWQADAEGRFTAVSPALAETVGLAAGDIIGRSWDEVSRSRASDPDGAVADLMRRRETWSGRTILWRVDHSDWEVPVEWAGMPVFGPGRVLTGFRGFGVLRAQEARERTGSFGGSAPAQSFGGIGAAPTDPEPADADGSIPTTETGAPEADARPVGTESGAADAGGSDASGPDRDDPMPSGSQPESWFAEIRERVTAQLARPAEREPTAGEAVATSADDPLSRVTERRPRLVEPMTRLSIAERSAFREIARALGARFEAADDPVPAPADEAVPVPEVGPYSEGSAEPAAPPPALDDGAFSEPAAAQRHAAPAPSTTEGILERLPLATLVVRDERVLFANRRFLDLVGGADFDGILAESGLQGLLDRGQPLPGSDDPRGPLTLAGAAGPIPAQASVSTIEWDKSPASLVLLHPAPPVELREVGAAERLEAVERELDRREARVRELEAVLDTATDGVAVLDEAGRIVSLNRSAEALFGYDAAEVTGEAFTVLLAVDSHKTALDYLDSLRAPGMGRLLNDGREVLGQVRQGGAIPLFMTMGPVTDGPAPRVCAVLRDMTAFKKAEGELVAAKRAAEEASAQKSDLLAKISHEIRTPLNAIIGFAEVMLEERFGPVGNERYKDYLKDVHSSGSHVISLVNDLLDLAKIEAGRLDLSFTGVNLNDLVSSCVALLQPQAARERIVVRTSFAQKLPPVMADERSLRQIALNLISNAIKFTDAGGQVIVSTAVTDRGEVAFRVRDTGIGMTQAEIASALEPFRQLATTRRRGGTGLGLPLTKALVEANRGALQIASAPREGTLVEVLFPAARVMAG